MEEEELIKDDNSINILDFLTNRIQNSSPGECVPSRGDWELSTSMILKYIPSLVYLLVGSSLPNRAGVKSETKTHLCRQYRTVVIQNTQSTDNLPQIRTGPKMMTHTIKIGKN